MTNHDVIRSTAAHIRKVGDYLTDRATEIMKRAVSHDASKWSEEESPLFEEATPKLADLTYGSPEYKESLDSIRPAIDHHNRVNSHHPEHYPQGIDGMDLLDLVEMVCDWKAASERHADGDIRVSLEKNRERFGISDQLMNVLWNSVNRWFLGGITESCQ